MGLFKNIFDYETKELKKINKLVDQIEALDEDMKKIKAMVEQLESDYGGYSQKLDEFFETVKELQNNLDNVNRILGSLSNLRLPF